MRTRRRRGLAALMVITMGVLFAAMLAAIAVALGASASEARLSSRALALRTAAESGLARALADLSDDAQAEGFQVELESAAGSPAIPVAFEVLQVEGGWGVTSSAAPDGGSSRHVLARVDRRGGHPVVVDYAESARPFDR